MTSARRFGGTTGLNGGWRRGTAARGHAERGAKTARRHPGEPGTAPLPHTPTDPWLVPFSWIGVERQEKLLRSPFFVWTGAQNDHLRPKIDRRRATLPAMPEGHAGRAPREPSTGQTSGSRGGRAGDDMETVSVTCLNSLYRSRDRLRDGDHEFNKNTI